MVEENLPDRTGKFRLGRHELLRYDKKNGGRIHRTLYTREVPSGIYNDDVLMWSYPTAVRVPSSLLNVKYLRGRVTSTVEDRPESSKAVGRFLAQAKVETFMRSADLGIKLRALKKELGFERRKVAYFGPVSPKKELKKTKTLPEFKAYQESLQEFRKQALSLIKGYRSKFSDYLLDFAQVLGILEEPNVRSGIGMYEVIPNFTVNYGGRIARVPEIPGVALLGCDGLDEREARYFHGGEESFLPETNKGSHGPEEAIQQ